jgi:hypothetical protein
MQQSVITLQPEKLAIFARLAHVLEEASTLAWEISVGDTEAPLTIPDDIDELAETDPALADTIALMFNEEAKTAIRKSLAAHRAGKTRPIEDLFHEVHPIR